MKRIDDFLNTITMYRLVLYYLIGLLLVAGVYSVLGWLSFSIFALLFSVAFLLFVSVITNEIFARVFETTENVESIYISALILALIITPMKSLHDLPLFFWAAVWTAASKFIFALNKKHLFNPVALAVLITAFTLNFSASWWVGNIIMLPAVLVGGVLMVRKIRRWDLVLSFFATSLLTIVALGWLKGSSPVVTLQKAIELSPLLFFAFVMLTEPLTTPPTRNWRILYGGLVGVLFAPQLHLGSIYSTPELALVLGNLFSYAVSPKLKLMLQLKEKIQLSPDLYDFLFTTDHKLEFEPGQYLEWTLGHDHPDSRGNRRYFTIASSPTEPEIRMGVKFYDNSSSYKKKLLLLQPGEKILAGQLAGDFTLPKDPTQKLVFIAGGIGITPFRSILKYLIDTNQARDIVLFYANKTADEIVYTDVFQAAQQRLGTRVIYTLSDANLLPKNWTGKLGRITAEMVHAEVPDFMEREFYLSGPHAMVTSYEEVLHSLGVQKKKIKTDFFPGFV